jgi:hypothetical protein
LPVLLKAAQHREIALIQYRTTVFLDTASACTLLLFGSTMLRHGSIGEENDRAPMIRRQFFMKTFAARARTCEGSKHRATGRSGSDHHQIDAAVFEACPRQTIPRHPLDPVPVLTEIARSLMLGWKLGLQTAGLARISVRDLEKNRLLSLFHVELCPQPVAHRLFLCERWKGTLLGSADPTRALRRYCVASCANIRTDAGTNVFV